MFQRSRSKAPSDSVTILPRASGKIGVVELYSWTNYQLADILTKQYKRTVRICSSTPKHEEFEPRKLSDAFKKERMNKRSAFVLNNSGGIAVQVNFSSQSITTALSLENGSLFEGESEFENLLHHTEFTQGIQTFFSHKASHKASLKDPKKKAVPLLIPYGRFTKMIIYYVGSTSNVHRRPESPRHLPGDDFLLGNLKFIPKGETDEVFGMAIPKPLITEAIQQSSYYPKYLEMVAKNTKKTPQDSASKQSVHGTKHATTQNGSSSTNQPSQHIRSQQSNGTSGEGDIPPLNWPRSEFRMASRKRRRYEQKVVTEALQLKLTKKQDEVAIDHSHIRRRDICSLLKQAGSDLDKDMRIWDETDNFGAQFLMTNPIEVNSGLKIMLYGQLLVNAPVMISHLLTFFTGQRSTNNIEATTIITTLPEITPFIALPLRVCELEQDMSEVKKTNHSAAVLASIQSQVPTVVDKYLGTKLCALLESMKDSLQICYEILSVAFAPES
ncbi:hypothetical protein Tco_0911706 [Tanacetum coccineum]|uniref:Uncharacterized protein n=1 Tax=Tanacetum coccineum TaxID=301880 RepID=A0ABQ5CWH4_9ASTR